MSTYSSQCLEKRHHQDYFDVASSYVENNVRLIFWVASQTGELEFTRYLGIEQAKHLKELLQQAITNLEKFNG